MFILMVHACVYLSISKAFSMNYIISYAMNFIWKL